MPEHLRTVLAGKRLAAAAVLAMLLILALGRTGASLVQAAPANDNFANAIAVTTPTTSGIVAAADTTGASVEAGEPASLSGCNSTGKTVWYDWTSPAGTGTVIFDTFGSNFDTILGIYTGSAV